MFNGPPGNSKGTCVSELFGGKCYGIPEPCSKGILEPNFSTQCASPCEGYTTTMTTTKTTKTTTTDGKFCHLTLFSIN